LHDLDLEPVAHQSVGPAPSLRVCLSLIETPTSTLAGNRTPPLILSSGICKNTLRTTNGGPTAGQHHVAMGRNGMLSNVQYEYGAPVARHTGRFIFVVSHMRSFSSLLCHILGSHPEISGYA